MRRTKIICTLGPATETSETLRGLIRAGADIFRFNMSHAQHGWVRTVVRRIRQLEQELESPLAILLDTQGPAIRTGALPNELELKRGDFLELRVAGCAREGKIFGRCQLCRTGERCQRRRHGSRRQWRHPARGHEQESRPNSLQGRDRRKAGLAPAHQSPRRACESSRPNEKGSARYRSRCRDGASISSRSVSRGRKTTSKNCGASCEKRRAAHKSSPKSKTNPRCNISTR